MTDTTVILICAAYVVAMISYAIACKSKKRCKCGGKFDKPGMTVKTRYAVGDEIDLGVYVHGYGGEKRKIVRLSIEVSEREPIYVDYYFDRYSYVKLKETEESIKLLRFSP